MARAGADTAEEALVLLAERLGVDIAWAAGVGPSPGTGSPADAAPHLPVGTRVRLPAEGWEPAWDGVVVESVARSGTPRSGFVTVEFPAESTGFDWPVRRSIPVHMLEVLPTEAD